MKVAAGQLHHLEHDAEEDEQCRGSDREVHVGGGFDYGSVFFGALNLRFPHSCGVPVHEARIGNSGEAVARFSANGGFLPANDGGEGILGVSRGGEGGDTDIKRGIR